MQPLRLSQRIAALIIPFAGIVGAAPAWASDADIAATIGPGYSAAGATLGAPTELQIQLRGEVHARCRMTAPPSLSGRIDFNRAGNAQSRFGLDCNAPFLLSITSGHGGFASQSSLEGVAPVIRYEMAVDVDTDSGMNALGWCQSAQLTDDAGTQCAFGPQGWSSGDATAINRTASLSVRWNAPTEHDAPVLGQYRDTIVVNVAVRS